MEHTQIKGCGRRQTQLRRRHRQLTTHGLANCAFLAVDGMITVERTWFHAPATHNAEEFHGIQSNPLFIRRCLRSERSESIKSHGMQRALAILILFMTQFLYERATR
jgi:hypothetical protein